MAEANGVEGPQEYKAIDPDPDSRLAQLLAAYPDAKARSDSAAEQLKLITDGIKAELVRAAPGSSEIEVTSGPALLKLQARKSWRLDQKALKKAVPALYVQFCEQKTAWYLNPVKS